MCGSKNGARLMTVDRAEAARRKGKVQFDPGKLQASALVDQASKRPFSGDRPQFNRAFFACRLSVEACQWESLFQDL